jgi:integration host factor subunit alpha
LKKIDLAPKTLHSTDLKGGTYMSLTKAHIIEAIYKQTGFTLRKSTEMVETLLEIIKSTLEYGDDVLVSGFGKFCVKEKGERKGRNPAIGEDLILRARRVVTFKCSGQLRKKVNRS